MITTILLIIGVLLATQALLALVYAIAYTRISVNAMATYSGMLHIQAIRRSSEERQQHFMSESYIRFLWEHPQKKQMLATLRHIGLWFVEIWEKVRDRNEKKAEKIMDDPRIGKQAHYKTWATGTVIEIWRFASDGTEYIKIKDGDSEIDDEAKEFVVSWH